MMNHFKTTLLLSLLTVLMVLMGSAVGGKAGTIFAFFMATAINFFSYWFSNKLVLLMYGAREVNSPGKAGDFMILTPQRGLFAISRVKTKALMSG